MNTSGIKFSSFLKGSPLNIKDVFLLCLFMGLVHVPLTAQSSGGNEDVIYLVNGSQYRGEVLDWQDDGAVRIRTWSGLELDIPKDMIKKVVQKKIARQDPRQTRRGWFGTAGIGLGFNDSGVLAEFDVSCGYRFHRMAMMSIGTGVTALDVGVYSQLRTVPIFLEWRAYPWVRRLSPYVVIRNGISFPGESGGDSWSERDYRPSYMGMALAGLQLGSLGEASFVLEGGYQLDIINSRISWTDWQGNPYSNKREQVFQKWVFRMGVIF
ncbi:MAG: hypothetical protein K9I85_06550 [Saprospiraceae bacterium]|nr:hypothetical protein [Saprospiraceae bacterium]